MCLINSSMAQPEMESHAKQELTRYMTLRESSNKRTDDTKVDIKHADLFMFPNMNTGAIRQGYVKFKFKCLNQIFTFDFDLHNNLKIDSVVFHSTRLNVSRINGVAQAQLPGGLGKNKEDSIEIYYNGTPDMSTRAYFRDVNISGPTIATLSQPYGAHWWWPCRENLYDKIDSLDVRILVDTPFYAVSNGVLQNVINYGPVKLYHYSHSYPIATYLVAVSISKYIKYTDVAYLSSVNKNIDIINHVFPHNDNLDNRNRTAATAPIMHLFDSLFGTYPFHKEHYGHAQFAWSGGMEHQTMSFMANFNYDLVAHELAHQWFGDKVTCGTWKDIWLNEGFATYLNLLCYNFLKPKSEWLSQIKSTQEDVLVETDGSVFAQDTGSVSALFNYRTTYQKGAMVLHQLRYYIGDSAFFNGLRNYLIDPQISYGFSKQDNLKFHLEASSGKDLDDYFNDWIMGEGYPTYQINWSQKGKQFTVSYTQSNSHPSVTNFNVPVPIVLYGTGNEMAYKIQVNGLSDTQSFEVPFKVKEVVVDPDRWLLAKYELTFPLPENIALSLYPNPFTTQINFSSDDVDIEAWELIDACGKTVMSKNYEESLLKGYIETIDAKALADGAYILKIQGSDRTIIKKLIKN